MFSRSAAPLLVVIVSALAVPGCGGPRPAANPPNVKPPSVVKEPAAAAPDPHAAHRHAAPDQTDLEAEMAARRPPPAPVDPVVKQRFV